MTTEETKSQNLLDKDTEESESTETKPSLLSRVAFRWITPIVTQARSGALQSSSIPPLSEKDTTSTVITKLKRSYKPSKHTLLTSILKSYIWLIAELFVAGVVYGILIYSDTFIKSSALKEIKAGENVKSIQIMVKLIFLFTTLSIMETLRAILIAFYEYKSRKASLHLRASLLGMLHQKALKFNLKTSKEYTEGMISNLYQVDIQRASTFLYEVMKFLNNSILAIMALAYLVHMTGYDIIAIGLAVYILANVGYALIFYLINRINLLLLEAKDSRIALFKAIASSFEFVKINSLENYFCFKSFQSREKEVRRLKQLSFLSGLEASLHNLSGGVVNVAIMAYFVLFEDNTKDALTYANFIAVLDLLHKFQKHAGSLLTNFPYFVRTRVSIRRLDDFLGSEEISTEYITDIHLRSNPWAITIKNGAFRWQKTPQKQQTQKKERFTRNTKQNIEEEFARARAGSNLLTVNQERATLSDGYGSAGSDYNFRTRTIEDDAETDSIFRSGSGYLHRDFKLSSINLSIKKGENVAIFGRNNSGKSSFLYSILGEVEPSNEAVEVNRCGSLAFLGQDRWLVGGSILENVVAGAQVDEELLRRVLITTQLYSEVFGEFRFGLHTEVGGAGETVSGGQRGRIALARCLYQK